MPILRQNNKRLTADLDLTRAEIAGMKAALAEANESMAALREHSETSAKRAYDQALRDLTEQRRVAVREGDGERIVELEDQLDALKTSGPAIPKAEKKATKEDPPTGTPTLSDSDKAEYEAWQTDNKEWLSDKTQSAYGASVAAFLRSTNPEVKGRAFLDLISKEVEKRFPKESPVNRVEGGQRNDGQGTGRKTFASLPADAKEACTRQAEKLVGKNKAFKTMAEWQAHYVQTYDWS
jgi:hypothetical protein